MNLRKTLAVAAATGAVLVLGTSVGGADAPEPVVSPHSHYVVTADGDRIPVGPDGCANGKSIAFDKFHFNGHRGVPGELGVIVGGGCPTS